MAKAEVKVTLDDAAIRRVLETDEVPAATAKAAGRVRDRAKSIITRAGRVDTGQMRNEVQVRRVQTGGGEVTFEVVAAAPHSIYQHEGVKGPVYPRRAKVLRFKPKGSNQFVFARYTSGFKGVPFLTDALKTLTVSDFAA